ncbi:hypothetical protein ABIE56_004539, partial [Luteibacter sp. 621]
ALARDGVCGEHPSRASALLQGEVRRAVERAVKKSRLSAGFFLLGVRRFFFFLFRHALFQVVDVLPTLLEAHIGHDPLL